MFRFLEQPVEGSPRAIRSIVNRVFNVSKRGCFALEDRSWWQYSKFSKPVIPVSPVTVTVTVLRLDGRGGERFSFHSSWKLVERAHAVEFSRLPP